MFLVAKSYRNLPRVGEEFFSAGKYYVNVQMKNGKIKPVRAYSEKEYAKLYKEEPLEKDEQKKALGFAKDFIWIFNPEVGMNEEDEYFLNSQARFHKSWGWYFVSDEELPQDLPFRYNSIKLPWETVGLPNGALKTESEVNVSVERFFTPNSAISNYPHSIGEKIEVEVTLERMTPVETGFGIATLFRMIGVADDLPYIWITSAKRNWQVGRQFKIKGTIKDLKNRDGEFQVVLLRVTDKE